MSESPSKTMRPLSPTYKSNISEQQPSDGCDDVASPEDRGLMKSPTPSAARMLKSAEDDHDGENRSSRECSFLLSPIGRMELNTPNKTMSVSHDVGGGNYAGGRTTSDADARHDGARMSSGGGGGSKDIVLDSSFPDNRGDVDIQSPDADYNDEDDNYAAEEDESTGEEVAQEETEEERARREIEESEALARQLMAEEAMASYAMSTEFLRENADQFSSEDFAALQAAMAEEDPEANYDDDEAGDVEYEVDGEDVDYDGEVEGESSREMSYDALLRLGERIGDVKEERWALVARQRINTLPTLQFVPSMAEGKEENHTEVKCQVCQFPYEEGEVLRRLPCEHCFHKDCVDSWLETKDTCAFCRKSIVSSPGK